MALGIAIPIVDSWLVTNTIFVVDGSPVDTLMGRVGNIALL